MKVRILYCRPCGYRARAEALASELRTRFGATVETAPGKLGQFDVFVDDELVATRSKNLVSRLLPPPKAGAVVAAIEAALAAREGDHCNVPTGNRSH
jgi:selT/selW/selH-like putative selenoprotein